jgi:hypothetical protein
MGKEQQSKKETKKQPLLSPKEKKAAKDAKKSAKATTPLVIAKQELSITYPPTRIKYFPRIDRVVR